MFIRPGSVQMNEQIEAIKDFENYLIPLRTIYSLNLLEENNEELFKIERTTFNLRTFLHRQKLFLHGNEYKKLKYIPKVKKYLIKISNNINY